MTDVAAIANQTSTEATQVSASFKELLAVAKNCKQRWSIQSELRVRREARGKKQGEARGKRQENIIKYISPAPLLSSSH
jgi:hypothetical protein